MGSLGSLGILAKFPALLATAALTLAASALAATFDIPPANFPRPATPPLGVNLEFVQDNATSMMFVDCMKSARKFGSAEAPWDESTPVGPDGWPAGDCGAVVMASTTVQPGDYLFSCTGRCDVSTPATASKIKSIGYDRAKNQTLGIITIPPGNDHLFIAFKKTDGGVRNIRLLRPGYTLNSKETFTREFLKAIEPFSTLRLMDVLHTNTTDASEWKDRTLPDGPNQSNPRGMAWEYGIQLANQTHKDLWINIPVLATDDYVKQLAQLMKEKLDKDRVVYIEYSNELWNAIFPQFGKNNELAEKEVAAGNAALKDDDTEDNKWYWGWRHTAERCVQIGQIFRGVCGDDAMMTRIRPVLASQAANSFILKTQLRFVEHHFGPPNKFIFGIAGAPYISPDEKVLKQANLTVDQMFKPGFEEALTGWVKSATMEYQTVAIYYRLHSLCYEGGIGIDGDENLKVKIASQYDPRIEAVVENYLNNWYAQGGELFMYFNLAGAYSKYGCWGLTDDIHKLTAPKMKGAITVATEPTPPITAGAPVPGHWMATTSMTSTGFGKLEADGMGGKCIASLGDKDCVDFLLNVKQEGIYSVSVQTAAPGDGTHLEMLLSGQSIGTMNCKDTKDWHKFAMNTPAIVHLQPGQLTLRLRVIGKAPNIRMVNFDRIGGNTPAVDPAASAKAPAYPPSRPTPQSPPPPQRHKARPHHPAPRESTSSAENIDHVSRLSCFSWPFIGF